LDVRPVIIITLHQRTLIGRQLAEATFQMLQSNFKFWPQCLTALHYFLGQTSFEQGLPALPPFDPLTRLVQGESAGPRRKRMRRIISVKFLPERDGRLLNNILRVRDIRNQRGHIAKDFPLTAQKQREKLLLGSVLVPKTVR